MLPAASLASTAAHLPPRLTAAFSPPCLLPSSFPRPRSSSLTCTRPSTAPRRRPAPPTRTGERRRRQRVPPTPQPPPLAASPCCAPHQHSLPPVHLCSPPRLPCLQRLQRPEAAGVHLEPLPGRPLLLPRRRPHHPPLWAQGESGPQLLRSAWLFIQRAARLAACRLDALRAALHLPQPPRAGGLLRSSAAPSLDSPGRCACHLPIRLRRGGWHLRYQRESRLEAAAGRRLAAPAGRCRHRLASLPPARSYLKPTHV